MRTLFSGLASVLLPPAYNTSELTRMLGFGVTHVSRPEDWPIMPVEILRVHLKPSGFFDVSFHHVFHHGSLADLFLSC